jgi:hypothetical protein
MPHMITAGVTPLYVAHLSGRHPGLEPPRLAEDNIAAAGGVIGYGYQLAEQFELRLRLAVLKPLPTSGAHPELLRRGLLELRAVVAPSVLVPLVDERLDALVGFEGGPSLWRLPVAGAARDTTSHAAGATASAVLGLRGWVTHHTGFWLELSGGYAKATGRQLTIVSAWPLQATVGWADRF